MKAPIASLSPTLREASSRPYSRPKYLASSSSSARRRFWVTYSVAKETSRRPNTRIRLLPSSSKCWYQDSRRPLPPCIWRRMRSRAACGQGFAGLPSIDTPEARRIASISSRENRRCLPMVRNTRSRPRSPQCLRVDSLTPRILQAV